MKTFSSVEAGVQTTTTVRRECQIFEFQPVLPAPRKVKKGRPFSEFAKEFSLGEDHDEILGEARRWLGDQLKEADGTQTLSSLRLAQGLSQERLGELIGTKQPNIARTEKGGDNPGIELMRRWCIALKIDMNTFDLAHQASATQKSRKEK